MKKEITKTMQIKIDKNNLKLNASLEKIKALQNANTFTNTIAIQLMEDIIKNNAQNYVTNSYALAFAIVSSKIKSLQKHSFSDKIDDIYKNIKLCYDFKNKCLKVDTYINTYNQLFYYTFNKDGEKILACKDIDNANDIINKISSLANCDIDLIQDVQMLLLEYINKAEKLTSDYLIKEFKKVIASSTTYKNNEQKPAELFRYKYTNIIKELGNVVSQKIYSEKAIQDNNVCYEQLENYVEVDDDTIQVIKYKRIDCAYTIDDIFDGNGKSFTQVGNTCLIEKFDKIPSICNFTKTENKIYNMHFIKGQSITQIANNLHIEQHTTEIHINNIKKAIIDKRKVLFPSMSDNDIKKHIDNYMQGKKVACFDLDNNYICTFDSLGKASQVLNVDKGNISKVLKGIRKSEKGYIFKYAKN